MGRCLYYSSTYYEYAGNATEARAKCRGLNPGAELVSIANKAQEDEIFGQIYRIFV